MSYVYCMKCSVEVPESSAYIEEGGHVCESCFNQAQVDEGFKGPYTAMGSTAILLALLSWCNPLMCFPFIGAIFPVLSLVASISALRYPSYLDPAEQKLLEQHAWVKVAAIISLFIAGPALLWELAKIFKIAFV